MNSETLKLMYEYDIWANNRILDAAEKLAPEQLRAPNDLGWNSLFGALVHILDAEYYWRTFLMDNTETDWVEEDDFAGLAALRERWAVENEGLRHYIASLTDEKINAPFVYERDGETRQRPLWHFLVHVYTHSTQHRSECAALLTGFGASPGDMDFTRFLSSR